MALHALVKDGAVVSGPEPLPQQWRDPETEILHVFRTRDGEIAWSKAELKSLDWLPVTEINATFDPALQVRTGPTLEVLATIVKATYSVRAKTAGEINAEKGAAATRGVDALGKSISVMHDQESRLRILEGAPTITLAAYRAGLIATFKGL